jgi:8-oxo-dGTP pyrophosphatase MutT (NUDIX family)
MDQRLAISIKGVLIEGGAVVLLENERDEWELPGGRLEPGETPRPAWRENFMRNWVQLCRSAPSSTPGSTRF